MNRVVLVTGAGSGIGRATAELALAGGDAVVAVDVSAEALAWTEAVDAVDAVATVAGDVTDEEVNAEAVATARRRFGRLDGAVFNAGVTGSGDLLDLPLDRFDRCIEVNVRAVVLGLRAAVPALRESPAGRVAIVASTSGIAADPNMWPYNAAKAAAINLARSTALDLAADGITVNAVCPGPTETAMTAGIKDRPDRYEGLRRAIPMQRWADPAEVAAVINFLTSASASFITGAVIPVDGGITANTGQFQPRPLPDR
jgi:NAD(P)-dependent dehydrogenase (short-subunit alcohol dehydrogenase family)